MQAGPRIAMNGHTLIVPATWYNKNAACTWSQFGFQFDPHTTSWKRDTRLPINGKEYTPRTWLESTREQFFSFWPWLTADRECPSCSHLFGPEDAKQVYCVDCIDIVQEQDKEMIA